MWKGQHFSWMAYERIVLSRKTNKKCIKGQAFWHRVGASLYETTLGLLLICLGRVKSDWVRGLEKRPKGQYGLVKLEISNWRKISALNADKSFANKTLRGGRKIRVWQSKPMAWKLFFRDSRVTLWKKDTVSFFKKGIREAYEWLTVRVGQHEREFRDTVCIKLRLI